MNLVSSIEHAYAIAIGDIKKAGSFVSNSVLPLLQKIHADAATIEAVTATVSPSLANIERVGDAVLGLVIKAVEDGNAAAQGGGVNITLDQQLVSDIRSIIPAVKAAAAPTVAAVTK